MAKKMNALPGSVHLQCARECAGMHCGEGPIAGCGD